MNMRSRRITSTITADTVANEYSKISRRRHRTTEFINMDATADNIKITVLLTVSVLLCIATLVNGQLECACAPREYTFRLDFSGTCPPDRLILSPNEYFGDGVNDYICSVGASPVRSSDSKHERLRVDDNELLANIPGLLVSSLAISDQIPVVLSSIQFIQQDEEGKPIESMLRPGYRSDGETVTFASSMFTKPEEIPYRITMILRGFNAASQAIMNTFTVEFTNTCGVPTFTEGERIGWVIFVSYVIALFSR